MTMKVLGVDVGLRICGYVLCDVRGLDVRLLKEGQIKPDPQRGFPQRLNHIFEELEKEIRVFSPQAIVVEKLYSHYRHPVTLKVLAEVRGVVALLSHRKGIDFFEYSSTRARKSFLGRGSVDSAQVKKMAENVTGKAFLSPHTADAFSLVVAFSHARKYSKMLHDCH
jgi:crossover junction endodeoxyribonuclease RuvC